LLARIVEIAVARDAMTAGQVYRKGMTIEKSLSILKKEIHSRQWKPELLQMFIIMIEEQA